MRITLFSFLLFLFSTTSVFADTTNNLSVDISSNGDVPTITVACTVGHAYTEALYNNSLSYMLGTNGISGGVHRLYCETGSISFAGWNMNTVLDSYVGVDNWLSYIHTPFKYIIVDTTDEGDCSSVASCAQYSLTGAWENWRNSIYVPSTTCYDGQLGPDTCTLAAGPIWTTMPYSHIWSDPRKDIPTPPPLGDPNNLPAHVSANGDVPAVSISCTPGHDYTLALVHEVGGVVDHNFGVVQRVYCWPGVNNNVIAFSAFNLSNLLTTHVDPSWWNYVHTPLEYIIKDTTGIFQCDDEYCPLVNEVGSFNNYDNSAYLASSSYWPTVGKGPVFDTTDHTTWFDVATSTGDSNVLFLPGLEASRLYYQKPNCVSNCEDQLWEPTILTNIPSLYLDSNGKSINNIYTRDILDSYPGTNVYKDFSIDMNSLVSSGKINQWTPYAYDWRQGIQDIVDNGTPYQNGTTSLIATLQTLVDSSKNGKVTIITHSNGGLLAKALIKRLQDMKAIGQSNLIDHIDNLVMIAVPQIGTADALPSLLDGYGQAIHALRFIPIMTTSQARDLAVNMSSAYGLLPSQPYFNQQGIINPASFSSSTPQIFTNKYGTDINTYQEEHDFVVGAEGRTQPADSDTNSPLVGNSSLLTQAEVLHNTIDNMIFPSSIKVIDIAGWGKDTVGGMIYGNGSLDPAFTPNGDGTVVQQSALYGNGIKYWLDLSHSKLNHTQIMEDPQILTFIDNVVQNTNNSSTLSTTQPLQVGNRLHLSVHSPVSIGVYDNLGNFTGKACDDSGNCTVQEDIPGSTYLEFGEGKYVNLGQGDLQKAVLQGTDAGTFTFDYQTVTPTGQTTTSIFQDIPVTTQTQATITVNATSSQPQLALDVTGDGVTDFTLVPNSTFDPITYLQVMEATINSLDLTQAKINAFDKRVDNIIKLIQKGKIDKAKLKAEKFETVLKNRLSKQDPKHPKKKLSKTDAQLLLDLLNGLLDNLS